MTPASAVKQAAAVLGLTMVVLVVLAVVATVLLVAVVLIFGAATEM